MSVTTGTTGTAAATATTTAAAATGTSTAVATANEATRRAMRARFPVPGRWCRRR